MMLLVKKIHRTVSILLAVLVLAASVTILILVSTPVNTNNSNGSSANYYTYNVVNVFPHDEHAFTEGLSFNGGVLFEGTGLYGTSYLRRIELETGRVLEEYTLPSNFFGEGVTVIGDLVVQLTYMEHTGFVYDKDSFKLLRSFSYPTQGWGLTHNGTHLVMSDGTANLYFLDLETFEKVGQIVVHDGNVSVGKLNELELIKGEIYANIFGEKTIVKIDPQTGQITGYVDLSKLQGPNDANPDSVLNGIAYDAANDRLFVTGKNWPWLYEIRITRRN